MYDDPFLEPIRDSIAFGMTADVVQSELLDLNPEQYFVSLVLALGKPKEEVVLVPLNEDGSTTYYRDKNQIHYVPKRSLDDILI